MHSEAVCIQAAECIQPGIGNRQQAIGLDMHRIYLDMHNICVNIVYLGRFCMKTRSLYEKGRFPKNVLPTTKGDKFINSYLTFINSYLTYLIDYVLYLFDYISLLLSLLLSLLISLLISLYFHLLVAEDSQCEVASTTLTLKRCLFAPAEPVPRRLLHPTTRQGPEILDKAPKYQTKLKILDKVPKYQTKPLNIWQGSKILNKTPQY